MRKIVVTVITVLISSWCYAGGEVPLPPELPSRTQSSAQSRDTGDDIVLPESSAADPLPTAERPAAEKPVAEKPVAEKPSVDCDPKPAPKPVPKVHDVTLKNKELAKVTCKCEKQTCPKQTCPKAKPEVRIRWRDRPAPPPRVEYVYVDRPAPPAPPAPQPKTVTVEKRTAPPHALTFLVGKGPAGFYTELEKQPGGTKEYKFYKDTGVFAGVMYQYYFTPTFGLGAGYLSNDTYMAAGSVRWGN